jgi:DNA-binding winged helix-turn-helix (wHTH) protein
MKSMSRPSARKHGSRIRLRDQPWQVLAMLLEHPGRVVSREDLQRRLWPHDVIVDFENNLNTAIGRLREALGDSADHPRFIETLPRRGYRFVAPVSHVPETVEPPSQKKPTQDLVAYDSYIQGRRYLDRSESPESWKKAREFLEAAVARDPQFALAYDALAELWWTAGFFAFMSPKTALSTGIVHALRAVEIDNTLAEAHALLAQYLKQLAYDWAVSSAKWRWRCN